MAWTEKYPRGYRGRYRDKQRNIHDVRDAAGSIRYFTKKKDAKQAALDEESKLRQGTWFDPQSGAITFSDYFEQKWIPNRAFELNTNQYYWSLYRKSLKPRWGDVELRAIMPSDVQGWVAEMIREGVTPATIQHRVKAFQTVLAARKGASAMRDKLIQFNPVAGVELPTVPDPEVTIYTPDETDALLVEMDPWWRLIPLFALETGCRWGEVMGVTVDDFAFGYRAVTIRRTILEPDGGKKVTGNGTRFMWKDYPKGKKQRTISLSRAASTVVGEWIATLGLGPGDRLFSMPDLTLPPEWHPPLTLEWEPLRTEAWPEGIPISRNHFREFVWLPAIAAARVPQRTFHDMRASHISWLLAGGLDLPTVMERVGHTQFQTTKRYTAAMEDVDERALDALDVVRSRFNGGRRAQ